MKSLTSAIIGSSLAQVGTTIAALVAGVVVLEVLVWLVAAKLLRMRNALVPMLLAPAIVGLAALVVVPIGYEVRLAFSNMSLRQFRNRPSASRTAGRTCRASSRSRCSSRPCSSRCSCAPWPGPSCR